MDPPQDIGEGGFETGTQCEENADPSPHFDPPGSGVDQAFEHFEQGGLSSTVSADEPQAFAAFEFEADVIDGEELAFAQRTRGLRIADCGLWIVDCG
jgi:hypothetical protein